ncbi:citrate lyase acyl carrier protein (plasmid) [Klebsiella pneumoniae]|nr:citrate lyase acyl carrier protein [Klebsiella pneumoniae]WGQ33921.1 citrate lyase acyl carrier protein [Klebsiella pneumoniae]
MNDNNATPAVVALRIQQALQQAMPGETHHE